MSGYTKKNLMEVEDQAPKFDMPAEMQARFARSALRGKTLGLTLMTLAPNFRIPFGHKHSGQEEVYVVVRGSARIKVDNEVVDLREWDAIRFDKHTMRAVEAGPDGSTWRSAPETIRAMPRWCSAGGANSSRSSTN
jgi:mannose-6-phosphate isomerase-like protein (cupin superfamily)